MIRIQSCLICDDVRLEATGKTILIGIYGPTINITHPVDSDVGIQLFLWMEIETDAKTESPSHIELQAMVERPIPQTDQKAFSLKAKIDTGDTNTQQISLLFPCRIDLAHSLRFEMRDGDRWKVLKRLKVNPFSSESAQPS